MFDVSKFSWTEYSIQNQNGTFREWKFIPVEKLDLIRKINGTPLKSIWLYDAPNLSANRIGSFFIDFDCSGDIERAKQDACYIADFLERRYGLDKDSFEIIFSGSKGFGVVIPHQCFINDLLDNPRDAYRAVANLLRRQGCGTLDLGVYSDRHLWRLTNSKHPKTGLYRIQLTFDELHHSISEIRELAQNPKWVRYAEPEFSTKFNNEIFNLYKQIIKIEILRKQKKQNKDFSELSPLEKVPKKYRHVVVEGNRNPTITQLIGTLHKAGASYTEAREIILSFNQNYCRPSKPDEEAVIPLDHYYNK